MFDSHTIDYGLTTAALELLGFKLYESKAESSPLDQDPDPAYAVVYSTGGFRISFDVKGALLQFIGGKVAEKLTATLLKRLPKLDPTKWKSVVLADIDEAIATLRTNADKIDAWLIKKAKFKKSLADAIENAVEEPLKLALAAWRKKVADTDLTADTVGDVVEFVYGNLVNGVFKPYTAPLWEPAIRHTISASNPSGLDTGWHNPALVVTRIRNEVVT